MDGIDVIACRECRYGKLEKNANGEEIWCDYHDMWVDENDFCSWADYKDGCWKE